MSPEKPSSRIGMAVVGAGYWGPNIIRNMQENAQCELLAVCDKDTGKLERLRENHPHIPNLTTDYAQLLNDPAIDAVAIVTEIPSHFTLAQQALEAGKHVFVEKPLAATGKECALLGELASRVGKTLMVGHTFVYNPAVNKLKEISDSGTLGDVYYQHSQRLNLGRVQTSLNAFWSLAVHDVSIALHLFEELPHWVRAWGNAFITPGVEDVVFVNMAFPSGRLANIHASWLDPEKRRQVTLVGSRKMVVYDDVSLDRKLTIYDKGIEKQLSETKHPEYKDFSGFQLLTRTGDVSIPHLKFTEPLKVEIQHFVDCITGKVKKPLTGWQAGYEVVKTLEAAQESLQHGGLPIEINWEEHPAYARL